MVKRQPKRAPLKISFTEWTTLQLQLQTSCKNLKLTIKYNQLFYIMYCIYPPRTVCTTVSQVVQMWKILAK